MALVITLWFVIALEIASKVTMLFEIAYLIHAWQLPGSSERKALSYFWFFNKTADVFVPNFSSGRGFVLDTAISGPMQQKYVHNASSIQGYTCI